MGEKALQRDLARLREATHKWKTAWSDESDREMIRLYAEDAKGLAKFGEAVRRRNWKEAYRRARGMDTVVRDQIPQRLYNRVCRELGYA